MRRRGRVELDATRLEADQNGQPNNHTEPTPPLAEPPRLAIEPLHGAQRAIAHLVVAGEEAHLGVVAPHLEELVDPPLSILE